MSAAAPPPAGFRAREGRDWLWLALLTAFAWTLREGYVLAMQVDVPVQGDIRHYVAYAWNLLHHGTFSRVWPGEGLPVADAFRSPGYPLLIALAMRLAPGPTDWYPLVLQAQVLLGALSVSATFLLARCWLPRGWSIAAAGLLAVWPHHVVASGTLLGEVLFGFLLLLGLWLAAATRRGGVGRALGAGVALSCASLVNPVALLLPLVAALAAWRAGRGRLAGVLLLAGLAGPAAWQARAAIVDLHQAGPGRGAINLVQGSWPLYHEAYFQARRYDNPIAREMLAEMDAETRLLARDPAAGLARIWARLAQDPAGTAQWYLLRKPWLLWDWDIRIGVGDVYVQRVRNSPLETNPVWHGAKETLWALNPFVFLLAFAGVLLALRAWRNDPAASLVAGAILYLTAVHVVFQAEPRYAIAYRALELLLAVHALAWAGNRLAGRRRGASPSRGSAGTPAID